MSSKIIPRSPLDRLIKRAGAKRVSADAREQLALILEGVGLSLSRSAVLLANHAGRSTVTASDFVAVWQMIQGSGERLPKNLD